MKKAPTKFNAKLRAAKAAGNAAGINIDPAKSVGGFLGGIGKGIGGLFKSS